MTEPERVRLARIDERTERMSEQLDAMEKYIFRGNGKPSLASRVDALETRWQWAIAIAGAIGGIAAFAVEVIK